LIVPDNIHNSKPENIKSKNVFITGDNLEGLRHLQSAYTGKIDVIYIDPPYNTGKEFVYTDKFEFDDDKLQLVLGYGEKEIERLKAIQGKSSHSAWLTFIYPRMKLASKLLTDDGLIFVSIDDNEQANLKLLMDDIFGEKNFIAIYKWNKTSTPPSLSKKVRQKFEYVICFQKQNSDKIFNGGTTEGGDMPLLNDGNNIDELLFPKDKVFFKFDGIYKPGVYDRVELLNKIKITNGLSDTDINLKGPFKWKQNNLNDEISDGTIFHIKTEKFAIRYEKSGERIKVPADVISKTECGVGTNEDAKKEIEDLFEKEGLFDYPKPTSLIKYLINFVGNKDCLVLDFFAGSGSTADAVMQLNAEDNGNRKYIVIQLDEPSNPESETRKNGYATIDALSRERILRAGEKIKKANPMFADSLDVGFKHFRLIEAKVNAINKIFEFDPNSNKLFEEDMITPFEYKPSGTSGLETIIQTWLTIDGYPFNLSIDSIKLSGYTAQYIKENAVMYLIDREFSQEAMKSLLNKIGKNEIALNTVIVYPYSFSFEQMRELKNNLKNNIEKQVTIIERF